MQRQLTGALPKPRWPDGIALGKLDPVAVHALLRVAYGREQGDIPPQASDWWAAVSSDAEFDPSLAITASEPSGVPAGFVLCWTSCFIKDLAVRPDLRWRGIGAALLAEALARLAARGCEWVGLKVREDNAVARNLCAKMGFVESLTW